MKMIALSPTFFTATGGSLPYYFVQYLKKYIGTLFFCALFFLLLFSSYSALGQAQTIGSFPEMQGGIENQTVSTLPLGPANYTPNTTYTTFSRNNNASSVVVDILGTNGNSGPKSINWAAGSTSAAIFTPTAATDAVLSNTSYVVQFFARKNTSTSNRQFNVRVYTNGANYAEVATVQTGTSTYQKFTAIITSPTDAATGKTGYVGIKPKGGSFGTGLTYLLDDICMYAGTAVDVTAPADATAPTITSASSTTLGVGWTAPVTGVDGGGYVVVRYATNPVSEPAPTANGIYGVGNTIGTGTVAYIGTGTGFTDVGLTANTTYYYKVYVADKAFNYSPTPLTVAGYTGLANPTAVTFTTPAGCATDRLILSWTGPLSYSSANNTILAFLRQTTAVNAGTPTSSPTIYTASTVFSSPVLPAYQNDAAAYCIYKGDGTNAAGDHSGLTITGLIPGTTYQLLMYNVQDAGPTYPLSGGVTATGTTLAVALAEPTNQPTAFAKGTVSTINIAPSWTAAAAGAQAPTGYYLQISNIATPTDAGAISPLDATDVPDQTNVTAGTANVKVTPNTAIGYGSFTGFTAGTMYYLRNNSYTNTGSCINYKAGGPIINVATLPNEVTVPSMSLSGTTGTISWTAAAGYNATNHTTLVFVRATTAVITGTPTANPSTYTASTVFSSPSTFYQLDGAATCVYKGDGTSVNITGLTAGTTYQVLILTVVDAANSDATHSYSIYTTTSATSGAIYTWIAGNTAGAWTTTTNWTPTRTTPAITDILVFNTGETIKPTTLLTQTIAQLIVTNNTTLTYEGAGGSKTLTITNNNGLLNSDLIISAGSTLNISRVVPNTSSITLTTNTTADISGTLIVNSSGCNYNTNVSGNLTTISGLLKNAGSAVCTLATYMLITSTGTYEHALNGGTVPTATWNIGSTCLISGITSGTSIAGHAQSFSNFVWDCPSQTSNPFVLGVGTTNASPCAIGNNLIVKRTGTGLLQLTSTGGQKDFSCFNYYQYGGTVAITYNTSDGGLVRSLTVNNLFYVNDSLASGNSKFQIINNPGGSTNISGRLIVKGNIDMNIEFTSSVLEAYKDNTSNPSIAELWFTGTTAQAAKFSTISGNIDFITSNTGAGVTLNSNATASKFKLTQGPFYIDANTLTINDAVSYPAPGTGTLGGINTSNLTLGLNGTTGTLNFISGFRVLKDFTQLANNTVTLGTELAITAGTNAGRDSLGTGAVLNTNDNLILSSDINGTARLAQVATTATINGKVTVERYLPMDLTATARRWRLLTAPFKALNAPTINAAWQEGQSCPDRTNPYPYDPKPGYGTHITKSTTWAADGYDQGSTANSSLFYYNAGTWVAPANTNVVKITDNSGAYMLFARGDRSTLIAGTGVAASPTTLDPKGELNIGNVTVPMITSTAYQTIGNPYASQIKLDNIDFNGTLGKSKTVYLWDPKTAGSFNVGKFISCAGAGNGTYTYSANTSGYSNGVIEPSNAFLVQGIGSAGNIVFHETDKTFTSSTVGIASRPVLTPNQFGVIRSLHTELHVIKNGVPLLADGIATTFNRNYKNTIDNFDAPKLSSFNTKEVLSIKSNNQLLSIERRKNIVVTDTIFLQITNLNQTTYQFIFKPALFNATFNALLEDSYLGTTTPISLTQNTAVLFNITNQAASAIVNRFKIILYKNQPIKNIALSAALVNNNVALNWASTDDEDATATTIERSKDGNAFTALASTTPLPNAAGALAYNWLDENIVWGKYQYRIKYTDITGKTAYSNIVTITKNNNIDKPAIVPNPASNGQINLNMGNLPKGSYTTKVCNSVGQEIFKGKFDYKDEQSKIKIALPIQQGMYYITLLLEDKAVTTLHFLML